MQQTVQRIYFSIKPKHAVDSGPRIDKLDIKKAYAICIGLFELLKMVGRAGFEPATN
jgi:hypothetical protein